MDMIGEWIRDIAVFLIVLLRLYSTQCREKITGNISGSLPG